MTAEISQGPKSTIHFECNLELLFGIYWKCRGGQGSMTFRLCALLPTINLLGVNL